MKNKFIYIIMALILGFASCTEDYNEDVASPQSYEQDTLLSLEFDASLSGDFLSPIVLSDSTLEDYFTAATVTQTPDLSGSDSMNYILAIADNEAMENALLLETVKNGADITVLGSALNDTVKSIFGKAPNANTIYVQVFAYYITGSHALLAGTPELGTAVVTPVAPVIESAYYIIGDFNSWSFDALPDYQFSHSSEDVYTDPEFSILVNMTAGNYYKIVPQSSLDEYTNGTGNQWNGVIGNPTDGSTDLEGDLIIGGNAMKVDQDGWVKVTLNMMEYTYTVELIGDMTLTLYVPGNYQGWTPSTAATLFTRNYDFVYEGYVNLVGEFKVTSQPDWSGTNYGDGGDGTLSTDGSAGNLSVTDSAFYLVKVDLSGSPYTYSITKTDWGIIGDATAGAWDNSTAMALDPETYTYSVTTSLTAGSLKFRANDAWDINLGGDTSNLTYGGDNISVSEAGTYVITLDLSDPSAYKCSIVKQ